MAKRIRIAGCGVLAAYLLILCDVLFFSKQYGRGLDILEYRYNLIPFQEIWRYLKYSAQLDSYTITSNLLGNVIAFLPLGLILPIIRKRLRNVWKILLLCILLSCGIEILQLFTKVGCCDVDDVILNTMGSMLGFGLFRICNAIRRKIYG